MILTGWKFDFPLLSTKAIMNCRFNLVFSLINLLLATLVILRLVKRFATLLCGTKTNFKSFKRWAIYNYNSYFASCKVFSKRNPAIPIVLKLSDFI